MSLQQNIERWFDQDTVGIDQARALHAFDKFKFFLNRGEIRAAEKILDKWKVNQWVKKGILLGFRLGEIEDLSINGEFRFFDKSTYPLKKLTREDGIRHVPGGSAIRDGAFVAKGVICMPPMYINVGAYVDEQTMVDSHVLIGSCAQVGKRVHISAATQLGGVLEPIGELPVIVEDDVFIGGNCGIYDGALIRQRAVIASGVIFTKGTKVYDVVKQKIYERQGDTPLIIPEGAVVVPGTRSLSVEWGRQEGLSIATPIIIKYRDEKTDAATALEGTLR